MMKKTKLLSSIRASRITYIGIAVTFGLLAVSFLAAFRYWNCLSEGETIGSTLRNVAVIMAALVALPLAITRILVVGGQADTAEGSLANDRYQRGAEMLGRDEKQEMVRVAGIDALREVARQYPNQYARPVMRLLCAFLFKHCKNAHKVPRFANRDDLQAAIEAIATFGPDQRGTYRDEGNQRAVNLGGITFSDATLCGMNLVGLDFRNSGFDGSHLDRVDFSGANLHGVSFQSVFMRDTILDGAQITGAQFSSRVKGLTQKQLDKAVADQVNPPVLNGTLDAGTGEPLVWRQ